MPYICVRQYACYTTLDFPKVISALETPSTCYYTPSAGPEEECGRAAARGSPNLERGPADIRVRNTQIPTQPFRTTETPGLSRSGPPYSTRARSPAHKSLPTLSHRTGHKNNGRGESLLAKEVGLALITAEMKQSVPEVTHHGGCTWTIWYTTAAGPFGARHWRSNSCLEVGSGYVNTDRSVICGMARERLGVVGLRRVYRASLFYRRRAR